MTEELPTAELDRPRIEKLGAALCMAVKDHYASVQGRGAVLEALNALAGVTAVIFHSTGNDPLAREFFDIAVADELLGLMMNSQPLHPGGSA